MVKSVANPGRLRSAAIALVVTLATITATPQEAAACSCWHPSVEEHLQSTNVIFSGVVKEVRNEEIKNSPWPAEVATFDVETEWKGSLGTEAEVSYAQSDGANCGWSFEPGERATVFALRGEGGMSTGMCYMIPYSRRGLQPAYDHALEVFRSQWLALAAYAAARPNDLQAQLGLAVFLEEANDLDGAGKAYAAAVEAEPENFRGHAGYGRVLFAMQQFSEAIGPLKRAASLAPDDDEVGRLLGQARVKSGDLTDLTALDFRGFEIGDIDLTSAEMTGRDFSESRLTKPDFSGAKLVGTSFIDAYLQLASFAGTDLRWAKLDRIDSYRADLTKADLSQASLRDAKLFAATLEGANLTGVDARNSNFESTTTAGARFDDANLTGASFRKAQAADTDFADAILDGADFRGADLSGAILSGTSVFGARFDGARHDCRTKLPPGFDPDPWPMIAVDAVCDGQPMNRDFSGMTLEFLNFSGLDLAGANFRGTTFGPGVWFWGANLRGADFSNSQGADEFRDADLTGADFTGARDVGSFYGGAKDSKPAILKGTKFHGVKLEPRFFTTGQDGVAPADISVADLQGAIIDCSSWDRLSDKDRLTPLYQAVGRAESALLKSLDPEAQGFTVLGTCPQ